MKKKKIFSMLCAMSVMFNMITTPVFAEELNTTSVVSENTDVLPSEDIDLFSENDKINSENEEESIEEDETVRFVVATKVDGFWTVNIKAKDISRNWKENSSFELIDFEFAKNTVSDENGELELVFTNTEDYENGYVISLFFYNKEANEQKKLFIDFSDTGIPTFLSETMREHVEGNTEVFSRGKMESVILPDQSEIGTITDNKQRLNEEREAPDEIILAENNSHQQEMISDSPMTRATTAATQYYVYNTSGRKVNTFNNPFKAIEYISKEGLDGYFIKQSNDNQEIFRLNRSEPFTFYKFQFTNFYGTTTSTDEAEKWTINYAYAHVVRSDGIFGTSTENSANQPYSHSYKSLLRNPEIWSLEGNTGAYVYRRSVYNAGYKSISSTVNLTSAKLKFDDDTPYNAYVYMSSNSSGKKQSIGCDLGLISSSGNPGNWYLISNRTNGSEGNDSISEMYKPYSGMPLVTSNYVNGEYIPNSNVELKYSYRNGSVYMVARNISKGYEQKIEIFDSRFDTSSPNICLMTGTSLVPNVKNKSNKTVVADIKSGAYLKNVIWDNNLIYSGSNWTGTSSTFNGSTSKTTNYLLIYDTDNASCSVSGGTETVNIHYNPTYKQ